MNTSTTFPTRKPVDQAESLTSGDARFWGARDYKSGSSISSIALFKSRKTHYRRLDFQPDHRDNGKRPSSIVYVIASAVEAVSGFLN